MNNSGPNLQGDPLNYNEKAGATGFEPALPDRQSGVLTVALYPRVSSIIGFSSKIVATDTIIYHGNNNSAMRRM